MIDAKAVLAHISELVDKGPDEHSSEGRSVTDWLQNEVQQLNLEHDRDAEGNLWITLHGKSDRTVLLGSYLDGRGAGAGDSHIGLVSGLETVKAISRREDGRPPCTLQLVIWASPRDLDTGRGVPRSHGFDSKVAAYLELQFSQEGDSEQDSPTPRAEGVPTPQFNPRLMALCDEAIRELTGEPAPPPSPDLDGLQGTAGGTPTAVMNFKAPSSKNTEEGLHLHLLQAAEAFGRWTESTMHMVAGEEVDLWAREHRIPRT